MSSPVIVVVDFNGTEAWGRQLKAILEKLPVEDLRVRYASHRGPNIATAVQSVPSWLSEEHPDEAFLVLDRQLQRECPTLLKGLVERHSPTFVVLDQNDPQLTLKILQAGACDFLLPPLLEANVVPRALFWLKRLPTNGPASSLNEQLAINELLGESAVLQDELNKIPLVAACDASVLIMGETGTGKELCARAIHWRSCRSGKPFVAMNCGLIPGGLVENELFGHKAGAFTGAGESARGLIRAAEKGTLFLDELDALPAITQVKLLRFLQDKSYRPLGATRFVKADIRIMAATNCDLEQRVKERRFREDLYYRLNVVRLTMPPLRARDGDIPLLAQHFLRKYASEYGKSACQFGPGVMAKLTAYHWPGNVRELENVIARALVLSPRDSLEIADMVLPNVPQEGLAASFREEKAKLVQAFEKA